jgi:glycosyltransferase involved in cell wall biosynthesis
MAHVRVLINAVHAKSGGGITYLANLLPLLAQHADLEVHLCAQRAQADTIVALAGMVPVHWLPDRGTLWTVFAQEQVAVPLLARELGADVVFSPANFGPLFGVKGVTLLRNAFAVGALEKRPAKRLYWAVVKALSKASFARCRRAIAVSRHAGDAFLRAFDAEGDPRLEVVHHGVGPAFHPPKADGERHAQRLLAVSDLYVQKNIETLLVAVSRLAGRFPSLHLDIAGRPLDPDYFAHLKAVAAELGVAEKVTFLGGQPAAKVAQLYRQATVFVFPSLVETFGNPLVEAMASGTPVVAARAAATPEVVADAGLLTKPGDADDMAAAIARLLEDPGLWRQMSDKALARAGAFSWRKAADATARVLVAAAQG